MSERQCSTCVACCEGWLTSEKLKMRPGKPCTHCTAQGCAIYDTRPEKPCRKFKCAWLAEGEALPEHMRPDQCGAIVMLDRKWNGWSIIKAVPTGATIPEETIEWLKAYARDKKIPLLFSANLEKDGNYHGVTNMGYGPPAFVERVKLDIMPEDIMKF
jgi:hypothetical protein